VSSYEYKKCLVCNKRFKVQDWKKGIEKHWCFTCRLYLEYMVKDKNHNLLTPREKKMAGLRLYGNNTLEEVGKEFGVTRERIRQIEAKIMCIIKKYIQTYVLKEVTLKEVKNE